MGGLSGSTGGCITGGYVTAGYATAGDNAPRQRLKTVERHQQQKWIQLSNMTEFCAGCGISVL